MAKQVAKQWSEINCTNERHHWEEEARKDKLRYYHEKQMYKGPWRIINKRTKKDPNAPKRPMSAFLHFAQKERSVLKQMNPNLTFSEISTHLSENWKALSYEKRKPHLDWELKERAIYNKKAAEYKLKKEKEKHLKEQRAKEAALLKEKVSKEIKQVYDDSKFPSSNTPILHRPIQTSHNAVFPKSETNIQYGIESNKTTSNTLYQRNNDKIKDSAAQTAISQCYTKENGCSAFAQSQKKQSKNKSTAFTSPISEPQSKLQSPNIKSYRSVATFEIGAVGNHRINFEYYDGVQSPIPTMTLNRSSRMPSYTPIVVPSSSYICEENITFDSNCVNSKRCSIQVLCEVEQNFNTSHHNARRVDIEKTMLRNETYHQNRIPQDSKENYKPCHNNIESHFNAHDDVQKISRTNEEVLYPETIFDITRKHLSNDTFPNNSDNSDYENNFEDHNEGVTQLIPQSNEITSIMTDDVPYDISFPDAISSSSLGKV